MAKKKSKNPGKQQTANEDSEDSKGLSRRSFIRGTGLAVGAGVLLREGLLEAAGATLPGAAGVVGPGPVPVTLTINGKAHSLTIEPRVTLLDALRNHLDLTGAKKVCDRGTCGACTVLMDGKAIYSCTLLAIEAQGHAITTIEGIEPAEGLHPISNCFWENDAQQCGFCTPGFVMASKSYLDAHPNPTEAEVRRALGGNLCRCGTYMGVRRAVVDAAEKLKGGRA